MATVVLWQNQEQWNKFDVRPNNCAKCFAESLFDGQRQNCINWGRRQAGRPSYCCIGLELKRLHINPKFLLTFRNLIFPFLAPALALPVIKPFLRRSIGGALSRPPPGGGANHAAQSDSHRPGTNVPRLSAGGVGGHRLLLLFAGDAAATSTDTGGRRWRLRRRRGGPGRVQEIQRSGTADED